jgi:hypothetical protein
VLTRRAQLWAALGLAASIVVVGGDARGQGDGDVVQRPERMTAGVSDQLLGQLTRDGKTLYFVSNRNEINEIYRQEQGSSGAKLAFDEGADVTWPRLSPDGKRILYISFRDDAAGQLCVRDLPDKKRRCLKEPGSALQAQWVDGGRIVLVSRDSLQGDLRLVDVRVGRKLDGRTLVVRNLTSPTVSPDGRWIVYVPVQRYVERVGPGFAARAADRLEAMRLDRPGEAPVPLSIDLPGLSGQPAFSPDGHLYFTQFLNDSNGDGVIDASDHGVLFRVPFESARDDAPARAAAAWAEQLTESTWNCQYPSPAKEQLVTTCTRMGGSGLDIFALPADGQVPSDWSLDRLNLEVQFSARRSEEALLYRHILAKRQSVTGRRMAMMRLLRLHLFADEFDAADFYAQKIKANPDPATAGAATALAVWIDHRRAQRGRERGRMATDFVAESRQRLTRLEIGKTKAPAAIALKHIVRSEIFDALGDKDAAKSELDLVPVEEVTPPSVLETYYERADALYRELDDGAALAAACRRLAVHPALDDEARLRYARAVVRAMTRGLGYDEVEALLANTDAPAGSELAFAVELGRAVNTIRVEDPPKPLREALAALYKRQTRHDRQRAVVLDAVSRASALEAEKLVESMAQLYVDDGPPGTQERRRAQRLYERVMLSRAYRRLAKGKLESARDVFKSIADKTGSLEAFIGYIDVRLRLGRTAADVRGELTGRKDIAPPVADFVRAYLTARELPTLPHEAREKAIDDGIAALKRANPLLRGKPEPQVVWGALLHERYLDDADLPSAQKANLHYLLALELVPRNPRWRSTVLSQLSMLQEQVGNFRIALGPIGDRDKLPVGDDAGGLMHRLVQARTLFHVDREADAAKVADEAVAMVERTPALAEFRPLALDRAALYHLAADQFDRALALYDALLPQLDRKGERNLVVARLARAGAALGANQPRRALADLDAVDGQLADSRVTPELRWAHASPEAVVRAYGIIAAGLRANAHLRLGELGAASSALQRRRALAAERFAASGLDEHLRALTLVEARLADLERDRGNSAGAAHWLDLALDHADAYASKTGIPLHVDQLDLLRLAAELRLDKGLELKIDVPRRLSDAYDKLLAERDPSFRNQQRWLEIYLAVLAGR